MGGFGVAIDARPVRRSTSRLNVVLGGILLLVQFVAAAHSHASAGPRVVTSACGQSATEAPCGLCQFIRHSNPAPSRVLPLHGSRVAVGCVVERRVVTPCSLAPALPTERGPPASI